MAERNAQPPSSSVSYSCAEGSARWKGHVILDKAEFVGYLQRVVHACVTDSTSPFASTLQGLSTMDMATRHVQRLMDSAPIPEGWEVGEALAECLLCDDPDR